MTGLFRRIKDFIATWFLPRKPVISEEDGTEIRQRDFRRLKEQVFEAKEKATAQTGSLWDKDTEYQEVTPFQIRPPEGNDNRVSR